MDILTVWVLIYQESPLFHLNEGKEVRRIKIVLANISASIHLAKLSFKVLQNSYSGDQIVIFRETASQKMSSDYFLKFCKTLL